MRKQVIKRNLLIVCEGEITEPFYFKILADQAIEKGEWDNVEIVPKPRLPENKPEKEPKNHKRAKRTFQNPTIEVSEKGIMPADATEKKYLKGNTETWATPLRFVKEARDRFTEGAYDEVWVVFDRNGHPAHEAAFALAVETDKPVNIGFSSRSFEQWVLLHFEKSQLVFEATACKVRQKGQNIQLGCMSDKPLEGSCEGDKCLVGYIRKNYLADYSKKGNLAMIQLFEQLTQPQSIQTALINAAWLQAKQYVLLEKNDNKPYLINPYTNVDTLVKRLLNIHKNFIWSSVNQSVKVENLVIKVENTKKKLVITIKNEGKSAFSLNAQNLDNHFQLLNQTHQLPLTIDASVLINPNETKPIYLNFEAAGDVLLFKVGQHEVFIELTSH